MDKRAVPAALPANEKKFWKMRSGRYNRLEWARKENYLDAFVRRGCFKSSDEVLDIGTGTGIIAKAVAPRVRRVTAIDISPDMLKFAKKNARANERYLLGDVHSLKFPEASFSKITARMVFHHVTQDSARAIKECHRVLKPGGLMVLSEGVPPSKRVREWYTEMFRLKEDRITFYREDLVGLMRRGGFKDIRVHTFKMRQVSIRKWLEASGIPQVLQDRIYQMHLDLFPGGKRDYRMRITDADCFIDMKFLVLVGRKDKKGV